MNICYVIWVMLVPSIVSLGLMITAIYFETWIHGCEINKIADSSSSSSKLSSNLTFKTTDKTTNEQQLHSKLMQTRSFDNEKVKSAKGLNLNDYKKLYPNRNVLHTSNKYKLDNYENILAIPRIKYKSLFGLCVSYDYLKFNNALIFRNYLQANYNKSLKYYECENIKNAFKNNYLYCSTNNGKKYLLESSPNEATRSYSDCLAICDPMQEYFCESAKSKEHNCLTNTCINECFTMYYASFTVSARGTSFQLNSCITNCLKSTDECDIYNTNSDFLQVIFSDIRVNVFKHSSTECIECHRKMNPKSHLCSTKCLKDNNTKCKKQKKQQHTNCHNNNNCENSIQNEFWFDDLNKCFYYRFNLFNIFNDIISRNMYDEFNIENRIIEESIQNEKKFLNNNNNNKNSSGEETLNLKLLEMEFIPNTKKSSSNNRELLKKQKTNIENNRNLNDIFNSTVITLFFLSALLLVISIILLPFLYICSRKSNILVFLITMHIVFISIAFVFNLGALCIYFMSSLFKNEIIVDLNEKTHNDNISYMLNELVKLKSKAVYWLVNCQVFGNAFYISCGSTLSLFFTFMIACVNLYFFKGKVHDKLPYGSYDITKLNDKNDF